MEQPTFCFVCFLFLTKQKKGNKRLITYLKKSATLIGDSYVKNPD